MGGIQRDTSPSDPTPVPVVVQPAADTWWWVPNAVGVLAGVGLVAIGAFTGVRTDELVTAGLVLIAAAGGHAAGKQSPTP